MVWPLFQPRKVVCAPTLACSTPACSHAHSIARTPSNEENFCGYELNQIGEDKGSILGKLGEDTQCAGLSFTSHSFFVPTRSMWSE